METNTQWVHLPSFAETGAKPSCPGCGGTLTPQRSACKCTRCGYIVCETCDIEPLDNDWPSEMR